MGEEDPRKPRPRIKSQNISTQSKGAARWAGAVTLRTPRTVGQSVQVLE